TLVIICSECLLDRCWSCVLPIDNPTTFVFFIPWLSKRPAQSSAICEVVYGPGGLSEFPTPLLSTKIHLKCFSQNATCFSQADPGAVIPIISKRGSPVPRSS